jgi:hypothetical protein
METGEGSVFFPSGTEIGRTGNLDSTNATLDPETAGAAYVAPQDCDFVELRSCYAARTSLEEQSALSMPSIRNAV